MSVGLEGQKKKCALGGCEPLDEEGRQSIADWIVGFLNYEVVAAVLTSPSDYTNRKICAELILNAHVKTSFCRKLIFCYSCIKALHDEKTPTGDGHENIYFIISWWIKHNHISKKIKEINWFLSVPRHFFCNVVRFFSNTDARLVVKLIRFFNFWFLKHAEIVKVEFPLVSLCCIFPFLLWSRYISFCDPHWRLVDRV